MQMNQMNQINEAKTIIASGRRFTSKELIDIKDTVNICKNLSRTELAFTICEHLNWKTSRGKLKIDSCRKALERFEKLGLVVLPKKQIRKASNLREIKKTDKTDKIKSIECSLEKILPITLQIVKTKNERKLWNEYVERYHYLGYKQPFGAHLKYFIVSKGLKDQYLGCILFSSSAWSLASRDNWIGWSKKDKSKRLNLILNNSRFLIFPWINVKNLASKILSCAAKQVVTDWKEIYKYEPVLLETFVDTTKYQGTCYQSANWQHIGDTTGRGRMDRFNKNKGNIKKVYVYPLVLNFRSVLRNNHKSKKKDESSLCRVSTENNEFITYWEKVTNIVACVSAEFDQKWQKRKRIINTMLVILVIFRLLFSKNKQSYNITITSLWNNCHKMRLSLPKKTAIAASSFTEARKKLDEKIFKILNQKIISLYEQKLNSYNWFNHRIFAVDGTKLNLPKKLINEGFKIPASGYYPQGLASCLYHLKSKIPFDFDLVSHNNERVCAISHLQHLKSDDIVVYDRGYFSYSVLHYHNKSNISAVFRLSKNSYKVIDDFMQSEKMEDIVTINPTGHTKININKNYPQINIVPLKLRLLKYKINETTFYIGTTLLDFKYDINFIKDVYHSRWGIEELYKISKHLIEVENFHAKSVRGVKQELFAHFLLLTISRIFSNHAEEEYSKVDSDDNFTNTTSNSSSKFLKNIFQVNFKNCLAVISSYLEPLFIYNSNLINDVIKIVTTSISNIKQKIRPNRVFRRFSMKPINKWRARNKVDKTKELVIA